MASLDLQVWLLGAAVVAVAGWYFFHVFQRLRQGIVVLKTMPGAFGRAFDDAVPFWLRMARAIMVVLLLAGGTWLLLRKFGISVSWA